MTTLQIHNVLLIVKYLTNNNGSQYYQRRIPQALQSRLGKQKFSIALDRSKGPAVIQVHRLARFHDKLFSALKADPNMVLSDEKLAALALLENFGLQEGDGNVHLSPLPDRSTQPHLDEFENYLIETARDRPLTSSEEFARRALKGPLPALLSELPEVYLSAHQRGQEEGFRRTTNEYWGKLLSFCGDMPVASFTRDNAKAFRDYRQSLGLKSQTIQKDINVIKAIFQSAIRELELQSRNPFEHLRVNNLAQDAVKRETFSAEELRHILEASLGKEDEIRRIILLQLLSGARIGEIVGLRKRDCSLSGANPFMSFEVYANRTLKTKNSIRRVPLVPIAAEIIRRQIAESSGEALFPRYNDMTRGPKSDSASAAINKWFKESLNIPKTSHSFRHTMKDLLRDADITDDVSRQLLGHSSQSVADGYGRGLAMSKRLDALKRALQLVFDPTDQRIFMV